jgi:hypothetical protein
MPPLTSQENEIQAGRDGQAFGFDPMGEDNSQIFLPHYAARGLPPAGSHRQRRQEPADTRALPPTGVIPNRYLAPPKP